MNASKYLPWAAAWCVILTSQAWSGLPTAFRPLPDGIVNPKGYPLLPSIDESNPQRVSQKVVYYLPSSSSKSKIGIKNFNSTVLRNNKRGNMCVGLDTAFAAKNKAERAVADSLIGVLKKINDINVQRPVAQAKVADQCGEVDAIEEQMQKAQARVTAIDGELLIAKKAFAECLAAPGATQDICYEPIKQLIEEKAQLLAELAPLRSRLGPIAAPCTKARTELGYLDAEVEKLRDNYAGVLTIVDDHWDKVKKTYGSVHGGNLAATWDDGYTEAKRVLEEANPGLSVLELPKKMTNFYLGGFETVNPAFNAELAFSFGTTDSVGNGKLVEKFLGQNGTLDEGTTVENGKVAPDGSNAVDEKGAPYFSLIAKTPFGLSEHSQSPSAGGVSLLMTVPGACAILDKQEHGDHSNGVVLSASYLYGSGASVRAKASYNLWNIYKRIEKRGNRSKGFLGMTKVAYHDLTETIKGDDNFKFEFYSEDALDAAQQDKYRAELKKELMDRIANTFAQMSRAPGMEKLPAKADLPGYSHLRYTAPTWYTYGRLAFRTIEGMFGHQRSESTINQTWNRTVHEEWSFSRVTPMVGTFSIELTL